MAEYVWSVVRDQISAMFGGQSPRAEDDAAILEVFTAYPTRVLQVASELEAGVASGQVRSGWAVLRKRLGESRPDVTVSDAPDLAKRTRAAELWIRNAGLYFDREPQVVAELFDSQGLLWPFAQAVFDRDSDTYHAEGDTLLVARMVNLWRQERPRGERAEEASLAWQERCRLEGVEAERVKAARDVAAEDEVIEMDPAKRERARALVSTIGGQA